MPDLNKIDECFVEALGGLVSVVGNNMELSVKPINGGNTKITKVRFTQYVRLMAINGIMILGKGFIHYISHIYCQE